MLCKVSLLMQVTTSPDDRTTASPHTGGWSESLWLPVVPSVLREITQLWAQNRALLLPAQASIVGYRATSYTLSGNKLLPGGTSTGKFQIPGRSSLTTDLPQVSLELSGSSADGPNTNTNTLLLRGIPDDIMKGGEYTPTTSFKRDMTIFTRDVCVGQAWGFVGRDKSVPSARVLTIQTNVVKLDGNISAVAGTDYMRFNRVRDNNGNPITQLARIIDFTAPGTYTVAGLEGITAGNNGTARVDKLRFFDLATLTPSRARVKKIGRPFESYRGRGSKHRV